jgi:hypothetical protein
MKIKTFITLTIILMLFSFSCKETPPEPGNGGERDGGLLTVEDVGVTDAVLRLRIPSGFKSQTVTLKRDTTTIFHSAITTHTSLFDTLIIDEALLSKHSYNYTLTVNNFFNTQERCYAGITTMDTTSHNFTWQVDTLGDGSSLIRDVTIVNDTCVLIVGEIYKKDSLGNWEDEMYNMAKWDGRRWTLGKAYFTYQGRPYVTQLYSIYAFGENDIWVASTHPAHWGGTDWTQYPLGSSFPGYPKKFWGTSSLNLYMAGTDGSLAHYDGSQWQKIESWTDLDIVDIYGTHNSRTGEEEIIAVASKSYENQDHKILKIDGLNVTILPDSGIDDALTGVWFMPEKKYYVTGGSIYNKRNSISNPKWRRDIGSSYPYYKNSIRGNDINDVVVACDRGNLLHFNGYAWTTYYRWTRLDNGNYYSVAIKKDLIVAVGENYGRGVVAIGRR